MRKAGIPSKLTFLAISLIVSSLFTLACAQSQHSEMKTQKNVLLISIDDLGPMLGAYGQQHMHTPAMDRLADTGLQFNRAYVQVAWCSPSRTSMLTGLRPDSTRVYDLVTHFRDTIPEATTLPQYFKEWGYFTAAFGKVFHRGMDDSLSWSEGTWEPDVADPLKHYVLPENIARIDEPKVGYAAPTESAVVPDSAYPDGMITNRAIRTIQRVKDQPFFIAVGFYKPHMPFNAPQKYWDLYEYDDLDGPAVTELPEGISEFSFRRWKEHHNYDGVPQIPNGTPLPDSVARQLRHGYYAAVSYVDAQIEKIVGELEKAGLSDNTIIALWGDHGWKLGTYSTWSKHTLYEIDTRVPLLIYDPDRPSGSTDAIVELIDLYPTLAELAGLPVPEGIQGTSAGYLFEDSAAPGKQAALSQFIRNAEGTYTTYEESVAMGQSVRTDRYRLMRWILRDQEKDTVTGIELYDHHLDSEETVNVAGEEEYADTKKRLMKIADDRFEDPFLEN